MIRQGVTAMTLAMMLWAAGCGTPAETDGTGWVKEAVSSLETELVGVHGEAVRPRLRRGLDQVSRFWRAEDGDRAAFESFVRAHFAADQESHDAMFDRYQKLLEALDGHMGEIGREFRTQADLDLGPVRPFDEIFAGYSPSAHVNDDFFKNKLAFVALLNFPLTTLDERLADGARWTRRQWAEVRLAQRFSERIPADVNLAIASAASAADQYIAEYNIWMHHVLDEQGNRLFPPGMRLLSHWNLRDELKARYADTEQGIARQRVIRRVMERIVDQSIPAVVVNNPKVDWNPFANTVVVSTVDDAGGAPVGKADASAEREPDTRYATILGTYRAARLADPYTPTTPTHIARSFDVGREIPEPRVKAMLEQVLSSPMVPQVAALIEKRLGRPLEPFDIWYNGFRVKSKYSEAELDKIVAARYPDAESFRRDIPTILQKLGFTAERANTIAASIVVDPARGSGHAMGSGMRSAPTRLRTRVAATGMNYKGYNIAVHELGHNVEQVISLHNVDYTLLSGVPNTAFTEAVAFLFQSQDLSLLGLAADDPQGEALNTLNDFWGTYEIAGVALVDMRTWHWMYEHPEATPAELREAALSIARDVWNTFYAPVFKQRDVTLLAIYSHIVHSFLYLPDYPMGHLIAHQLEEKVKASGSVGSEVERVARLGRITPDLWMKAATGAPVGPEALLEATRKALSRVNG